ncbi:hypothetical protein ACWDFL_13985 [Streptomyces bungoensis]
MRLCTSLSPCLAAAAALLPVSPAVARTDASPSCAAPGDRAFPLTTKIHGGPRSYEAGGGFGTWYLDLTNTTRQTCADIHPVVVLVDDKRALKPSQAELDFYDGTRARTVTLQTTDEQELVGVLEGEGFGGFTVAPGKTVTVRLRLAVAADAVADQVTANAALVQKRGSDGDWVGESNAYRFVIGDGGTREPGTKEPGAKESGGEEPGVGESESGGTGTDPAPSSGAPRPTSATPGSTRGATPGTTPGASPGATPSASLPAVQEAQAAGEQERELARTGPRPARAVLAAVGVLLAVGGGAFLLARRRR